MEDSNGEEEQKNQRKQKRTYVVFAREIRRCNKTRVQFSFFEPYEKVEKVSPLNNIEDILSNGRLYFNDQRDLLNRIHKHRIEESIVNPRIRNYYHPPNIFSIERNSKRIEEPFYVTYRALKSKEIRSLKKELKGPAIFGLKFR